MKKRVHAIVLVIAMIFSMFGSVSFNVEEAKADTTVKIKFHYSREDNNYEGWNLWTWSDGNQPLTFDEKEENGVCATGTYKAGTKQVGFIVRLSQPDNEWAGKDVEADRSVDLSIVMGGTVHVYITSGKEAVDVNYDEAQVAKGDIIKSASVTEDALDTINFELAEPAADGKMQTTFSVESTKGAVVKVVSTTLNADNKTGVIKLANPISLMNTYVVKASNGIQVDIASPDYYSTQDFVSKYTYDGDDLGAAYTPSKTTFKLWAPTAHKVKIIFFKSGSDKTDDVDKEVFMSLGQQGVWTADVDGDLKNTYYMYKVTTPKGAVIAADPYAKSAGVNGVKSMVVDTESTNPNGWDKDENKTQKSITDASIYELHVRDFSAHEDSGITNKGKFLAFTEKGTKTSKGNTSGIDYLADLGVNYVHLMPAYDFGSVDENTCTGYNWGYDPVNYNVPEGSYSSNPADGSTRVNEYKQMVQALHNENIGVIMDVVYNHVYNTDEFCINKIMNGYFSRPNSNASGCGNDTATERAMVRKYIVDSVKYWATEYHIDGFRFDLMGLIDVDTMKAVREALNEINPEIIIYGEGWTMDTKTVQDVKLATQTNASELEGIAFFSDGMRDAIKGSSQEGNETTKGYVNGGAADDNKNKIANGFKGRADWTNLPSQVVNYASCHDNYGLWDKLCQSNADASEADRIKMNKMVAAIVYTSQGVPFTMQGEELLRSKKNQDGTYNGNSYNAPDSVNAIDYNLAADNKDVYDYYKGLIEFRKNHSALRLDNFEDVADNVEEIKNLDENVLAYKIKKCNKEISDGIVVIYNPNSTSTTVKLPSGKWKLCINDNKAGTKTIKSFRGKVKVNANACYVLVKGKTSIAGATTTASKKKIVKDPNVILAERESMNEELLLIVLAIIAGLIVVAGLFIYVSVFKGKLLTYEEIEILENQKRNEEKYTVECNNAEEDSTVYNMNNIDNTTQYATSLSDLLQMNDFKFDDEQHDF